MRGLILVLSASFFTAPFVGAQQLVGGPSSHADVWLTRKPADKNPFLDGLCHGLSSAGHPSGKMTCPSPEAQSAQARRNQFCATRYFAVPSPNGRTQTGVEFFDAFYSEPANANITPNKVIELYNAHACKDGKLPRIK